MVENDFTFILHFYPIAYKVERKMFYFYEKYHVRLCLNKTDYFIHCEFNIQYILCIFFRLVKIEISDLQDLKTINNLLINIIIYY